MKTQQSTSKALQVFVDTSAFKALTDLDDVFHQKILPVWEMLEQRGAVLVSTNYVLDESFTLIRARCGLKAVDTFRKYLAASAKAFKIIRVTIPDEAAAWEWFLHDWSKLSFTDCVSFAVMKRLRITRVVTFDKHFERAGMEIIC